MANQREPEVEGVSVNRGQRLGPLGGERERVIAPDRICPESTKVNYSRKLRLLNGAGNFIPKSIFTERAAEKISGPFILTFAAAEPRDQIGRIGVLAALLRKTGNLRSQQAAAQSSKSVSSPRGSLVAARCRNCGA